MHGCKKEDGGIYRQSSATERAILENMISEHKG